ncbi:hypothetical protein AiwAL_05515 [Acidiphilium sp. AL]|uniref:Sorbitol phosphotransferase enzyme II C-terminal domain-containing protein n=1 Tax=Acidiphilium iwatense TaxID=768198 RepID=A0ABS9DSG3_9PROT|nr:MULTISPECIES: hypothetical protein [Acidiphilium]MCF3945637.1 hypothetical protein [Acidiphilium iwatense]MCU4159559.1 hypothetical protein [Acidiphilium sp. AL]
MNDSPFSPVRVESGLGKVIAQVVGVLVGTQIAAGTIPRC